jgi:uncharacterized protein
MDSCGSSRTPGTPARAPVLEDAIARLAEVRQSDDHVFWQDSVSVGDGESFAPAHIQGHRQLTDVYLLGLAVANHSRLVTFDRSVSLQAVAGAEPQHLEILGEAPNTGAVIAPAHRAKPKLNG